MLNRAMKSAFAATDGRYAQYEKLNEHVSMVHVN